MKNYYEMIKIAKQMEEANKINRQLNLPSAYFLAKQYRSAFPDELIRLKQGFMDELLKPNISMAIWKDFGSITRISIENILAKHSVFFQLQNQTRPFYESLSFPTERVTDSLATIAAVSQFYGASEIATQLALKAPLAYQDFAYEQLMQLEKDVPEIGERRVLITDLAGELLDTSETASELGIILGEGAEESDELLPDINLYSALNQHTKHIYVPGSSIDVESAFSNALSVRINFLGLAIAKLIYDINRFAERGQDNGTTIFKPTNKSMFACSIISSVIATSETEFAEIVDWLYFLIYEGSGNANRLLPFVDEAILEALWRLKHLRLGFRHDTAHGSDKEILKKHQKIGAAYQSLIGQVMPKYPHEWTQAQLALYEQLEEMLLQIQDAQ